MNGNKQIKCLFILISIWTFALGTEIPANINLSFKTTVTVEKTTNPDCYAAAFSFSLEKQLYNSLDGEWDTTYCNIKAAKRDCEKCKKEINLETFDLNELTIKAPKFSTIENASFNIQMGYKEGLNDTIKMILTASNVSSTNLISGNYLFSKTNAFSALSDSIQKDIQIRKCDSRDSNGVSIRKYNLIHFSIILENTSTRLPETTAFQRFDVEIELKPKATTHQSI